MKKVIFGLFVVILFGCSKEVVKPTPTNPVVITPTIPVDLPKFVYYGKTSYTLKTPKKDFKNIDSIRTILGIRNKGIWNGTSNLGYVYVDINNDGLEDIFYPYSNSTNSNITPDVLVNTGNGYKLDNSMLPNEYLGNVLTRKTLVGDFNNDSLPDLFLVNSGWDAEPFSGEMCTLLLSDKTTNKYKLGNLSNLNSAFWHGGASGDLNGDGNIDIIVLGGHPAKVLYGDGKGNFNITDWKYNAGYGYITAEIVDVDNDSKNDIILTGSEGKPAPALYSHSTVFWNTNNDFSKQTIITQPSTNGWGTVMDIAVGDVDNDGTNEILLDRTGDISSIWYGGYNIVSYKSTDNYKTFNTIDNIKNNMIQTPVIGNWMTRMILYKNTNNQFVIQSDISGCYYYKDYRANPFTKTWIQNTTTKQFE